MSDTGKIVALVKALAPKADPAVIESAVQDWLDQHPEATTTVQDGSITEQKLATSIAQKLGLITQLSDEIDGIDSDVTDLKSALYKNDSIVGWVKGGFYANGNTTSEFNGTLSPKNCYPNDAIINVKANSRALIGFYDDYGTFLGKIGANGDINTTGGDWMYVTGEFNCGQYSPANARYIIISLMPTDSTTITTETANTWSTDHCEITGNKISHAEIDIYNIETELFDRNGQHLYFASSGYPTFDTVYTSNGKAISSVTITLPNGTMRIYLANGSILFQKDPPTEKTYTVDFNHSLVVDRNDNNTIKLITNGTSGNYILLFSVASVVSGLLAPYYFNTYFNKRVVDSVAYNATLKFVFFSDIHGAERNMRRIVGFVNSLESNKIDFVLNGGDTVQSRIDDGLAWYNTNVSACNKDVLICVGNHDEWESDGSSYKPADMNDVYDAEIAPMIQNVTGIVQPTNASTDGLCYYYKDYGNIRIIVLDAMIGHVQTNHYDSAQDTWFKSVLADAITYSKPVICVNHAPFKVQSGDTTIVPADNMGGWNCFKPYNTNGDSTFIDPGALDAVDDFITGGGSFIGWFAGHRHKDYVVKSTEHVGQTMFVVSTANNSLHELEGAETTDPANSLYDCFNYIGIDTTNKYVKIYRCGYNIDGGLKHKNTLCYDYENGSVVSWD